MATEKTTTEFGGYPTPLLAAEGENARAQALLAALAHLSELLEDCVDNRSVFPIATAMQSCIESATRHTDATSDALEALKKMEVSHGA